jgi:hypothetical protein
MADHEGMLEWTQLNENRNYFHAKTSVLLYAISEKYNRI